MGVGREGADDFHALFGEGVGFVDDAEWGLTACDVCEGRANVFRADEAGRDGVPGAEFLEGGLRVLADRNGVGIAGGESPLAPSTSFTEKPCLMVTFAVLSPGAIITRRLPTTSWRDFGAMRLRWAR